ncbi:MAG: SigB/SigF/SigG family RNA polymerase sigma factor [Solirubrobacteraceae bacterium]
MPIANVSTRRTNATARRYTPSASTNDLFHRWQRSHDQRAREQLVERFLPLARKLARRYHGAHEPLDDLVQVASLGLVKAIDRYDPDRGIAFSSFAVPTILGELKRYFRDVGWSVRVPRGTQELAIRVEQIQRRLTAQTGRPPTFHEIAEYAELSIEDVLDALEAAAAHHAVSLDIPREDSEGEIGTLGEAIGEIDGRFELIDTGTSIGEAAKHLSERERHVLALRFIADRTQTQIATEIGVSQMQVSRILRKSLGRLAELVQDGAESPCAVGGGAPNPRLRC